MVKSFEFLSEQSCSSEQC